MKIPEKKCWNKEFFNKGGTEETGRASGSSP